MIDLTKMRAELVRDEGIRLIVYDDATGLPIEAGSHVVGNPTIGVGRLVTARHGLTRDEAFYLLDNDVQAFLGVLGGLSWFPGMPPDRARAVVNMAFQLGASGMVSFTRMIAAIRVHDWTAAADAARASRWATETPARAARVIALLENGDAPPATPTGAA